MNQILEKLKNFRYADLGNIVRSHIMVDTYLNLEVKNHNAWYIFKLYFYKDGSIEFNYFCRSKRDYAFSNVGRVCGMNQCMIIMD